MPHDSWILLFSGIAAVASSVGVFITLLLLYIRSPRLKLSISKYSDKFVGFRVLLENVGGKPIPVKEVGIILHSGETLWAFGIVDASYKRRAVRLNERVPMPLPLRLNERICYFVNLSEVLVNDEDDRKEFKREIDINRTVAFANDTDGKCFWSHDSLARYLRIGKMN